MRLHTLGISGALAVAAGLVLFVVTFIVNALARIIAERGAARA